MFVYKKSDFKIIAYLKGKYKVSNN